MLSPPRFPFSTCAVLSPPSLPPVLLPQHLCPPSPFSHLSTCAVLSPPPSHPFSHLSTCAVLSPPSLPFSHLSTCAHPPRSPTSALVPTLPRSPTSALVQCFHHPPSRSPTSPPSLPLSSQHLCSAVPSPLARPAPALVQCCRHPDPAPVQHFCSAVHPSLITEPLCPLSPRPVAAGAGARRWHRRGGRV